MKSLVGDKFRPERFVLRTILSFLCTGAFLNIPFGFLLISNMFGGRGRGQCGKKTLPEWWGVGTNRPNWHSRRSLPFQGPKKSRFPGPNPSHLPSEWIYAHQKHYVWCRINHWCINCIFDLRNFYKIGLRKSSDELRSISSASIALPLVITERKITSSDC
jgi:hypothetical protein